MKVLDLINKLGEGKKVPSNIRILNEDYKFSSILKNYFCKKNGGWLFNGNTMNILNFDVINLDEEEEYKITKENANLIANLLYLEDCMDYQTTYIKDDKLSIFYDKLFPYTIVETIGLLIEYDFTSGELWIKFKTWFEEKYGSIMKNTFVYEKKEEVK